MKALIQQQKPLQVLIDGAMNHADYLSNERVGYIPYVAQHPLVDADGTFERAMTRYQAKSVADYLKSLK